MATICIATFRDGMTNVIWEVVLFGDKKVTCRPTGIVDPTTQVSLKAPPQFFAIVKDELVWEATKNVAFQEFRGKGFLPSLWQYQNSVYSWNRSTGEAVQEGGAAFRQTLPPPPRFFLLGAQSATTRASREAAGRKWAEEKFPKYFKQSPANTTGQRTLREVELERVLADMEKRNEQRVRELLKQIEELRDRHASSDVTGGPAAMSVETVIEDASAEELERSGSRKRGRDNDNDAPVTTAGDATVTSVSLAVGGIAHCAANDPSPIVVRPVDPGATPATPATPRASTSVMERPRRGHKTQVNAGRP
jgi:hypothetical protein